MSREYYYNPETTESTPDRELEWDYNKYFVYIQSNKFIRKILEKIEQESGCRVSTLRATLQAIGQCSHGFCTTATQKTIASKAALSVRTVQRCISMLRKYKVISTKHRYTKSPNKRRTSSKTIVNAFIKFMDWLDYQSTKLKNFAMTRKEDIKGFIGRAKRTAKKCNGDEYHRLINPVQGVML